jgi:hypothetical protein
MESSCGSREVAWVPCEYTVEFPVIDCEWTRALDEKAGAMDETRSLEASAAFLGSPQDEAFERRCVLLWPWLQRPDYEIIPLRTAYRINSGTPLSFSFSIRLARWVSIV